MRSSLRRLRDRAAAFNVHGRLGRLRGPELLILTYHRVLPRSHPDWAVEQPGMRVTPETLRMHLGELRKHFAMVDLDDWVDARLTGATLPRLACSVTFDDGWRDNYDYAFPILQEQGVPASIFLVTDLVGTSYSFWPNRLARLLGTLADASELLSWPRALCDRLREAGIHRFPVTPEQIDTAIEACKTLPDADLHALLDEAAGIAEGAEARRDLLDWDEIREMRAGGLVRFGSHTRRHTRLQAGLDPAVLNEEVKGSADAIEQRLGVRPSLFCYPNGDYDAVALELVAANYMAALSTQPGWNGPDSPLHCLRRVGLHEDVSSRPAGLFHRILSARHKSSR